MSNDSKHYIIHIMVTNNDEGKRTANIVQALYRITSDTLFHSLDDLILETQTLSKEGTIDDLNITAIDDISTYKLSETPKYITFNHLGNNHEIWYMPEHSMNVDGRFTTTRYSEWMNAVSRPFNDLPVEPEQLLLLTSFYNVGIVPQA